MQMIWIASLFLASWRWVMAVSTSATSCYATFNATAAVVLHCLFWLCILLALVFEEEWDFLITSNWRASLTVLFFFLTARSVSPQKPQSIYSAPNCHFQSPPSYRVFIRSLFVLALPFSWTAIRYKNKQLQRCSIINFMPPHHTFKHWRILEGSLRCNAKKKNI